MPTQISNAVVEKCFWEQVFSPLEQRLTRVRCEDSLSLLEVRVAPFCTSRGQTILLFEQVSNAVTPVTGW